jgi:subtilisin family serine protease
MKPRRWMQGRLRSPLCCCLWLMAQLIAPAAPAQIGNVQLPNLPRLGLPQGAIGTVNSVTNSLEPSNLADLRQLRLQQLLRSHRTVLEADPNGNPIVRAEIVAYSPSAEALGRARTLGFTILREQTSEALDVHIVVLRTPARSATRRALNQLRAADPAGTYDFNHIYLDSGTEPPGEIAATPNSQIEAGGASSSTQSAAASGIRVGLVDGGVDISHPVFRNTLIQHHGCGGKSIISAHGTAVASLLVGKSTLFSGVSPDAELFAADVYCGLDTGGDVDAIIDAIAWLTHELVPVINISLVGPPNLILEHVVKGAIGRGYLIVAAVGNDGPGASPLYPASYVGVVGVTAVDARRRVLLEAGRCPQVRFAAPGADMAAAGLSNSFAAVRGTSFAAPIVAGMLAQSIREPNVDAASDAIESLKRKAVDLGSRGFNPIYGYGLVGEEFRTSPTRALLAKPVAMTAN